MEATSTLWMDHPELEMPISTVNGEQSWSAPPGPEENLFLPWILQTQTLSVGMMCSGSSHTKIWGIPLGSRLLPGLILGPGW